jgi:hypothetical protein
MTDDDRSLERAARSWLEDGPTEAPDRAVEAALLRIQTLPQERDLGIPWRLPKMNTSARVAAAAVVGVLAIGGALYAIAPGRSGVGGPGPTPTPSPSPKVLIEGSLPPGMYVSTPFAGADALGVCSSQPGCVEDATDDSIRIIFTVPAGWEGAPRHSVALPTMGSPDGAWLVFERGASLYAEPCGNTPPPSIAVGPSVDDFANALVAHPKLDVTTPVDVTIDGYAGKYMDLQVPDDISACPDAYWPWEPGFYAQGPGHRWHLWILDVDGVRVVLRAMDFAATSAQHQAELQAIVDSIQIEP